MTDSDVYSVVYNSDAHLAEHVSGDMSAHRSTIFCYARSPFRSRSLDFRPAHMLCRLVRQSADCS